MGGYFFANTHPAYPWVDIWVNEPKKYYYLSVYYGVWSDSILQMAQSFPIKTFFHFFFLF